jgi:hypothetical protein
VRGAFGLVHAPRVEGARISAQSERFSERSTPISAFSGVMNAFPSSQPDDLRLSSQIPCPSKGQAVVYFFRLQSGTLDIGASVDPCSAGTRR